MKLIVAIIRPDRLNEVLGSTSWRLTQAAGAPLRKLRERRD